jgi:hypothetical protein
MNNFLALNYWFDLRPEALLPAAQKIFFGLLLALAALSVLTFIMKARGGIYRGFCQRLYSFGLANTVVGALLLFLNYESVPFLAARFWLGLWFIIMLAWLIFIILGLKSISRQKKEREQEAERKKYLP